jgi:hypothetical protein
MKNHSMDKKQTLKKIGTLFLKFLEWIGDAQKGKQVCST